MALPHTDTARTDLATILERPPFSPACPAPSFKCSPRAPCASTSKPASCSSLRTTPATASTSSQRGKVRIFKTSVSGREQVLAINQAGESIAELPVFDGGRFPASAMAIEQTEIAFISRQDFHAFCMEHPEVALKMLAVVGGRLRRLVGIIEELSFTTIRQRLISLLLRFAETEGKQTPQGIEFQLPVSHQELASQLGTVRELVSRNLMRLQAEGLLEVDARQIVVKDKAGLSALLTAAP